MENFIKQNWFKLSLLIIIIAVVGGGFYWFGIKQNNNSNFVNRQKCADQASKFFKDTGDTYKLSYTNHYNIKLNKCFVLIKFANPTDHGGGGGTHTSLYDTSENVLYAELWQTSDYPESCRFAFLKEKCSSKNDFENTIKIYMEN